MKNFLRLYVRNDLLLIIDKIIVRTQTTMHPIKIEEVYHIFIAISLKYIKFVFLQKHIVTTTLTIDHNEP